MALRPLQVGWILTAHRSHLRSAGSVFVASLFVMASCGSAVPPGSGAVRPSAPESPTTVEPERIVGVNEGAGVAGPVSEEWSPSGINHIVHWSEVGVVGTVTSVSHVPSGIRGMGYQQASLTVEQSLFGDADVNKVIEFAQLDPRGVEASVSGLPLEVLRDLRYGSEYVVGSRVVLLLSTLNLAGPEGVMDVLHPSFGYQSTWLIADEGVAASVDPRRTVLLAPLLDRIAAERLAPLVTADSDPGLVERDRATVRNPLGVDLDPSAPSTTAEPQRETGPFPSIVDSPDALQVAGPEGHDDIVATVGPTDSGGFAITVHDGTGHSAISAARDLNTLASLSGVALFTGDHIAVAGFGSPSVDPKSIAVETNSGAVPPFTVTVWQVEQRPIVIVVVPVGTTEVTVHGLNSDEATVWALPSDPYQVLGDSAPEQ